VLRTGAFDHTGKHYSSAEEMKKVTISFFNGNVSPLDHIVVSYKTWPSLADQIGNNKLRFEIFICPQYFSDQTNDL
jgi:hypothetical protein